MKKVASARDIVDRVASILSKRKRWAHNAAARDGEGKVCDPMSKGVAAVSLLTALRHAERELSPRGYGPFSDEALDFTDSVLCAADALDRAAAERSKGTVPYGIACAATFNDAKKTKFSEVKRAIARARELVR